MIPTLAVGIRTFGGIFPHKSGRKIHFDRVAVFKRAMASLLANTDVDAVFHVVDDKSTLPAQIDYLHELSKHPRVHVHYKQEQLGRQHSFAVLRVLAYRSKALFAYTMDDDFLASPGWASELLAAHEVLCRHWQGKPVGILGGFHREGDAFDETHDFEGLPFGLKKRWIGHCWLQSRECLEKSAWLSLEPTENWPANWTSAWIDDGSYQLQMRERGFEHAFIYAKRPTLLDHIGEFGVHSNAGNFVKGAK